MITALDQQIARVLNGNTKSGDKIQGLISLLRQKEQIIANLEQHNNTLKDCLITRNTATSEDGTWQLSIIRR